jgi:aromatic-L-amino-acid/L-tryptophan decarboxylase
MSLDPPPGKAFADFRSESHAMLDALLDRLEHVAEGPVWRPIPPEVRAAFRTSGLPRTGMPLADVHRRFLETVVPYGNGNTHPRFFGWVHGAGTPYGMIAEMLAAGLDANLGGRDHAPVEVEREVVRWMREAFGFPESATGLFVTGTSLANLLAIVVAKTRQLGPRARAEGLRGGADLVAYASEATHGCVSKGMEIAGLGSNALRRIAVDRDHRIDLARLRTAIEDDRAAGKVPFLVVGNAGTVDVGAIDDLSALADIAREHELFFHVDGAFGSLGILAPEIAPKLAGIERADAIALDFHKWGQVPYDAGFLLVRDGDAHRQAFASDLAYLAHETHGLAAGDPWFSDFGVDLSRGFRALKVWVTLLVLGTERLGAAMAETCRLARVLEARIRAEATLELLAPANLNIVCFRVRAADDETNRKIVVDVQERGLAAPSTTRIDGKVAIRAAIVNHRTAEHDVHALVDAVLESAARLA